MQGREIDWRTLSLPDLVDYIINTHHSYLNKALPQLRELTTAILRARGANHAELRQVQKLLHSLESALEAHLIDEEEVIFPLVKDYAREGSTIALSKAVTIAKELESEHDGAGDILRELRDITKDFAIPSDVCSTYRDSYEKLIELEGDIFQHIHLENNILYPRLEEELRKIQQQD